MTTITIRQSPDSKNVRVDINAEKLERLAASFGFFSSEFKKSITRSEREIISGKTKRLHNLQSLHSK